MLLPGEWQSPQREHFCLVIPWRLRKHLSWESPATIFPLLRASSTSTETLSPLSGEQTWSRPLTSPGRHAYPWCTSTLWVIIAAFLASLIWATRERWGCWTSKFPNESQKRSCPGQQPGNTGRPLHEPMYWRSQNIHPVWQSSGKTRDGLVFLLPWVLKGCFKTSHPKHEGR